MKTKLFTFGIIALFTIILIPQTIFAQEEILVEWDDGVGGIMVNSLRNTILADTNESGERNSHIYKLRRGGLYHITDPIDNKDFPLIIVGQTFEESGDDTDYGPAVIQRVSREDGSAPAGAMFRAQDDLMLKNIYLMAQTDQGVITAYAPIKLQGSGKTYSFDNVIFDKNYWFYPIVQGNDNNYFVTNCKFRNIYAQTQIWAGLTVQFNGTADSVIFENNTFLNIGGALFKAQSAPANYYRFNHNTVINVNREIDWAIKKRAYVTNNIFVNVFWNGQSYEQYSDPNNIDPYAGIFSVGDLPGAFGTNFEREIVLANNCNWLDPDFVSWYANPIAPDGSTLANPIRQQPFVNDTTLGWFEKWDNMVMVDNYLNEDPNLTTPVPDSVKSKMKQYIVDLYNNITTQRYDWDDNRLSSTNIIPPWPLHEDFTYSNATLLTGGTDGLPLGDLNWYPDKKQMFEDNKAQYVAAIEDMATAPELEIAATIQGEDLSFDNGASKYVVEGETWYEIEDMGTITWTVDITEAGTYSLVVYSKAPNGTKGNHIKVNGVGLKNRTTNGEWIFDYVYPAEGWLGTPITEDSLADNSQTPLQLTAGTQTISIEKSWGWMWFRNIEVLNASGEVVANLTAPDAVAENAKPGANAAWAPDGFKAVQLDAGGAASGTFDSPYTAKYLARIYFAADGMSDVSLSVNDAVVATVALSDTGDAFSAYFDLSQGSNSIKYSSAAGGVKIDKIQFILDKGSIITGVEDKNIPTNFVLKNNYPNPFNPTTTIEFSLRQTQNVKFAIYNIMGQRIKTLVDKKYSAGNHRIQWNGTNNLGNKISSGVYLGRMESGDFTKTIKLILMK